MSKLNLFIQAQITDNGISKDRVVFNEGQIDISSSIHGETIIAPGVTKQIFSGSGKYLFVQSNKPVEVYIDLEKTVLKPMNRGISLVDATMSIACDFTDLEIKNTSADSATIKFIVLE